MLSFALPSALWLALALVTVLALYFLRARFNRRPVGSLYIWARLAGRTSGGGRPRPRSLLLLALQVLAVLLAALSAAGPRLEETLVERPGTAYLVDLSASMAAEDARGARPGVTNRVDLAVALLREELAALPPDSPVALFACGAETRPVGKPGDSPAALAARAGLLAPRDEAFSEAAAAEALGTLIAERGPGWRAVLLSDGGLSLGGERLARAAEGALRVISVGVSGGGLGIGRLRLSPDGGGKALFQAWNGFGRVVEAGLALELDGKPLARASLALPPGWSRQELTLGDIVAQRHMEAWPVPGSYLLSIEGGARGGPPAGASARLSVGSPPPLAVALVGKADPRIKAALGYGDISLRLAKDFGRAPREDEVTLAFVEGVAPPSGLACDLVSFGPEGEDWPVSPGPAVSGAIESLEPGHPLLRFVDWAGARAEGATSLETGPGVVALASIGGKTVLAAWEEGGFSRLACGIDLSRSELGLSPALPVLLRNLVSASRPAADGQTAYTLTVGEIAQRAEPRSFSAPGLELGRRGNIVSLKAPSAGFFRWRRGAERGYIAADPPLGELDATPRRPAVPARPVEPAAAYERRERSLAAWPLALLCLVLVAEWLLWRGLPSRASGEAAP